MNCRKGAWPPGNGWGVTPPHTHSLPPAGLLDARMAASTLENQLHSAQKNLLFLQREHANTLKGLHAEIRRLQQHCTGDSVPPSPGCISASPLLRLLPRLRQAGRLGEHAPPPEGASMCYEAGELAVPSPETARPEQRRQGVREGLPFALVPVSGWPVPRSAGAVSTARHREGLEQSVASGALCPLPDWARVDPPLPEIGRAVPVSAAGWVGQDPSSPPSSLVRSRVSSPPSPKTGQQRLKAFCGNVL